MTLEDQYQQFKAAGFNPRTEILAYHEGKRNANGASLVDPIKSERADGKNDLTLRRFPKVNSQYLVEYGYKLYTPPAEPKPKAVKKTEEK